MSTNLRRLSLTVRLAAGLMLTLAAFGPTFPAAATAQATPAAGGSLTVTSTADTNTSDSGLTLREALLVARGGTGPSGLNRAASAAEQAALGGCTFNVGLITGGCGPGLANTIAFSSSLGANPTITLASALPPIDNTGPTALDGSINAVYPVVSASGLLSGTDGLAISSNGNTLRGLTVTGAPRDDLRLTGNSNQVLSGTVLLKAGQFGLHLAGGQSNFVAETAIGAVSIFPVIGYFPTCGHGNGQGGVLLDSGAAGNTITDTLIACSSGVGARFDGVSQNLLAWSVVINQTGDGLEMVDSAISNTVQASRVFDNGQYGALLSGAGTQNNFIGVDYNVPTQFLDIGTSPWTALAGNGRAGVRLEAGANQNQVQGAFMGTDPAIGAPFGNGGPGVEIDGAPNNQINTAYHNFRYNSIISYNNGPGVVITDSTGTAVGSANLIQYNAGAGIVVAGTTGAVLAPNGVTDNTGPGIELINTNNTLVLPQIVVNNTGAGVAVIGNTSTGDLIVPGADYGNGGIAIDLGNDGHTPNGAHAPPGPNDWLPYPLPLPNVLGDSAVVTGTACANCAVNIYAASGNAAANGGGGTLLQGALADGAGNWSTTLIDGYSLGGVAFQACSSPCSFGGGTGTHSDTSEIGPSLAGRFVVTGNGDDNNSDGSLTLREALLAVRGGTGPNGLNRPASAAEQASLGGCAFDGGGHITGGCGPGINNTIVFSAGLGVHPVITLTAALPALANTMPTRVDGTVNGVFPIINASGVVSDALLLTSNANAVTGLAVRGAPQDDVLITGDRNQVLTGTVLTQAGQFGLHIHGGLTNTVSQGQVGACGQANGRGGILIDAGAVANTVSGTLISCNSGVGVRLDGDAGTGGSGNEIHSTTITGETGNGIEIVNGTVGTSVFNSTIVRNTLDGILISGAATRDNSVSSSFIGVTASGAAAGNGQYGIQMSAGTYGNQSGFFCTVCLDIIAGNGLGGIRVDSGATGNALGGDIGLNPTGTAAVPNHGPGLSIDSAPSNTVGSIAVGSTVIAGNLGPGVLISNSAGTKADIFLVSVGQPGMGNSGPGVEIVNSDNSIITPEGIQNNSGPGVEIVNSSNAIITPFVIENNGGAGVAVDGNTSIHNFIRPVSDINNGGLPIDLGSDGFTPNGAHNPPGPNDWLPYPVLKATIGSVITGTACTNCTVYIYQAYGNPVAPGGGGTYAQQTQADGTGNWHATLLAGLTPYNISFQACQGQCSTVLGNFASDTSELGPVYHGIWLPLIRR